jgi:hypothetical protein
VAACRKGQPFVPVLAAACQCTDNAQLQSRNM